jgi:hypothetical protein
MRLVLFFALTALLSTVPIDAQTVDIGGIEVRLGGNATDAVAKLRASFVVDYQNSLKSWLVSKKATNNSPANASVALIGVEGANISYILKYYDLGDSRNISGVLSAALEEARRGSGHVCRTSMIASRQRLVRVIRTICGDYTVDLALSRVDTTNASAAMNSITLTVASTATKY